MNPTLHIHLLGDLSLTLGETPISSTIAPRAQSLLAYLVLHRGALQERSHLAFLLWPDSTEAQAHTNLRKALFHLRQALPEINQFLESGKHSIQWFIPSDSSWTLDVQDFEQALRQAEQAEQAQDAAAQRRALEQATHLYRGDLLPGCYDEWILPERDRFRQLFLAAAERLIALLEEERDYASAIAAGQHLLRQDALHEPTYRRLMRFYALRGERAAALRVYHTCVTVFERELGVEPGEATRTFYEALMQAETALETKTSRSAARGAAPLLLGRQAEWRQLQEAWRRASAGQPQFVLLAGEAGIGKTRLAEEMEAWANRQGITTASARCYAALGQLTYASITAWLRANAFQKGLAALDPPWLTEIARLLPEVLSQYPQLAQPFPMTEGWQRQHFFEALARAILSARQPLLLSLDDLQWCSSETFEWLHYLFRFQGEMRLLLVGTARTEEILPGHPLQTFTGVLQRDGLATEIALGPLSTAETASLAEHIVGHQLEPDTLATLYHETEGNPLFVVEMVRAGTFAYTNAASASDGAQTPRLASSAFPSTVQAVLSTRLAQLSPLAGELAGVAAVIGREFTFTVLARASDMTEEAVVQGLDELWQRRIVRERGAETAELYDFSHDKLREQAYASLSPAHRRLLHRRVAQAYEEVYAGDLDAVSGQIAVHFERASLAERSIPYYQRAAEAAMRLYANAQAISAFQRAATLLETERERNRDPRHRWESAAQISRSLGDVLVTVGRFQEARETYQRALSSLPSQEYIWRARMLRKMASTWNQASHNPLDTSHVNARQMFQEAEQLLDKADDRSNPTWLREWIDLQIDQLLPLRGTVEEMTNIIEKAQPIVEQHGTAEQRGQFFQAVMARDSKRNRYGASEQSLAYRRNSLTTILETGNKNLIGFAYFVLGNGLLFSEQLEEAEERMRTALKLAEQIGSTPLLVRCLTFLPLILRRRGNVEEVRAVITRVLSVPEARDVPLLKGHQAWLAWRDGRLAEAESNGRALLGEQEERQSNNAFRWTGLWPLLGVTLIQGRLAEAIAYARLLLDPELQPPPEQLGALLEVALRTWENGAQEEARALLQECARAARQTGHL